MTALGLFGVYLSTLAFFFSPLERTQNRVLMLFVAWILHLAATLVYYDYFLTHAADAQGYYNDPHHFYEKGVALGTWWVIFVVQSLKRLVGGTFLDYFLLFQAFGFWGVAIVMRTIEEIYARFRVKPPDAIFIICWLPGIHFWTSSIGKDGFLFLACSLAVWGAMAPRSRWLALATAFVIMLLFRAHIAFVAVIASAGATFLNKRKTLVQWLAMGILCVAVAVTIPTLKRAVFVDVTSAQSVSDFLETYSDATRRAGGGSALFAPFPVRMLSLFFRPLFFDTREMFGVVSSFENVAMIFIIGTVAWNWRTVKGMSSQIFAVRFWLLFFVVLSLFLTFLYYNVGLGLRHRTMFMPALIALFATVFAAGKGRRAAAHAASPSAMSGLHQAPHVS